MKHRFCLLFLVFLIPANPLLAEEMSVSSRVSRVTVFPDRAMVTRSSEFAVPEGESTILMEGFPGGMIEQSIRVEGISRGGVSIGSVQTRRVFTEELVGEEERQMTQALAALRDERHTLKDWIQALKIQLKLIETIGKEIPKVANEEIMQGIMDPEMWEKSWLIVGTGAAETFNSIRQAEIQIRDIDNKIKKNERELARIRTGHRETVQLGVNIEARRAETVRLNASYLVWGASWTPLYDARLEEEAEKVTLTQLGQVRQNTGEEWSNVNLTLSTARPAEGARIPELDPWFIDFARIEPMFEGRAGELKQRTMDKLEGLAEAPSAFMPETPAEKLNAPKRAQVVASEFTAEYKIPGTSRVPSDNEPHKFTITEHIIEAHLAAQIVPKVTPRAFLFTDSKYEGTAPLLPGPVSVFRGGTYIGVNQIKTLRPGETVKLSFGTDDKVRVEYRLDTGGRSREGLFAKQRRVERRYRTTVENYHSRPIEISVLDQLPVPQDERIKVELLKDSTAPTDRDVEGRKGVLGWVYTYKPEEKQILRFGYAVIYPEEERIPGF